MGGLPMYMLRLACDVDWENEQACFKTFCRETAHFYSKLPQPSENVRIIIVQNLLDMLFKIRFVSYGNLELLPTIKVVE